MVATRTMNRGNPFKYRVYRGDTKEQYKYKTRRKCIIRLQRRRIDERDIARFKMGFRRHPPSSFLLAPPFVQKPVLRLVQYSPPGGIAEQSWEV
jgi:hypothetical protein